MKGENYVNYIYGLMCNSKNTSKPSAELLQKSLKNPHMLIKYNQSQTREADTKLLDTKSYACNYKSIGYANIIRTLINNYSNFCPSPHPLYYVSPVPLMGSPAGFLHAHWQPDPRRGSLPCQSHPD